MHDVTSNTIDDFSIRAIGFAVFSGGFAVLGDPVPTAVPNLTTASIATIDLSFRNTLLGSEIVVSNEFTSLQITELPPVPI